VMNDSGCGGMSSVLTNCEREEIGDDLVSKHGSTN
jgi:hypothetical protein